MQNDEYEIAIGKLVIIKMFLTQQHEDVIDNVIEALKDEYLENYMSREL